MFQGDPFENKIKMRDNSKMKIISRDKFINEIFRNKILEIKAVPFIIFAIQLADEYISHGNDYSKQLIISSDNIIKKYYLDGYNSEYKNDDLEYDILKTVDWKIPKINFLVSYMKIWKDYYFNNKFIFFMTREICRLRLIDVNPKTLIIAMILLYRRRKLRFYREYIEDKYSSLLYWMK